MEKNRLVGTILLAIFDLVCSLILFFFAIMLQGCSWYLLLALLYFISGILILMQNITIFKILLYGIMPLNVLISTLAIFEIISLMGGSPEDPYYTPIKVGLIIIGLTILFPFFCNIYYFTRPKIKEQFR
ncbi:MAG: hypothetical protein JSV30_02240 [Candidatus Omnitrophota bacterium]|nr:MAG: hypothetical protein JSV30_02240 [Candidatus Omnitrophota bacterium]